MEHRRQFLICKKEVSHPNFRHVELTSGFFLNYHIELDIAVSDCKSNFLIGLAFKSKEGSISQDLNNLTSENFADITSDWSGRWVVLVENTLHIDPGGMLGCYYGVQKGSLAISSSLGLLDEQFDLETDNDFKEIEHGKAMNWFPPPLTKLIGIKKLLIGQDLNIGEGTIEETEKKKNKFLDLQPSDVYIELATRLATIVKNISMIYGDDVYLPLTGGFDSRTILAALLNSKLSFTAFLFKHENISHADKNVPSVLSKKFCFPLHFINRTNVIDKEMYDQYMKHSSGQAADAGVLFYSSGQYEPLAIMSENKKKIILRGGVWEVGRKIFTTASIDESLTSEEDIIDNLKFCFPILKESKLHEESVRLWIRHTQSTHSNLGFKDRFYLEQRVSGWLSAIEQAADLTDFDRIHPANCQDILDLLSISESHPQSEIIRQLEPELLNTPFNRKSIKEFLNKLASYTYRKLSL